ncbi:MAG: hypothetical protein KJ626_14340 [Verrucomicrobia bacterium]|nr:hypothetical protein [Verrucomicrobiota bacterium]
MAIVSRLPCLLLTALACLCLPACTVPELSEPAREEVPEAVPDVTEKVEAPVEKADAPVEARRVYKPGPVFDWGGKMLMVHYMPWYETKAFRGKWGRHWTGHKREHNPEHIGADGLPDIWSHYHPLIGPYDSADPDALECQLLQMKLAGINGVIADWYGIGKTDDYPLIHDATLALFDAASGYGMKFAVCYEDRAAELLVKRNKLQSQDLTTHLTETLQWMQEEWFSKPQYLRYQGGPLLMNFGPMYIRDPGVWKAAFESVRDRPTFYALHHLWRKVAADGGFTWIHHAPWEDPDDKKTILVRIGEAFSYFTKNPEEAIVSAYPGFKDVYGRGGKVLAHRQGETMRESLQVGMERDWKMIQLVTWNDYGEGTMIEPTHEFGYTFLEIIQEARRKERGGDFPFTSDDLRLPARLYALRKRGDIEPARLDDISSLLNRGSCVRARQGIERLEQN